MVDYFLNCFSEQFGFCYYKNKLVEKHPFLPKFKFPEETENLQKVGEFFSENYEKIEKIYDCKFKPEIKKFVDPKNLDEFSTDVAGRLGLFFDKVLNPENFGKNILDFEEENFGSEGWWVVKN